MKKTVELVLSSELDGAAFDRARWQWVDESGEPERYMDDAWQCLVGAYEFINDSIAGGDAYRASYDRTGNVITCESVHGPGTERFFPGSMLSIFTGWGTLKEFGKVDASEAWRHCDDESLVLQCADAWNKHAGRLHYLYDKLDSLELAEMDDLNGSKFMPAMNYAWYENAYQTELDNAAQDVCDVLNAYLDASETYAYSVEAFNESIWECDDEQWFTTDGNLYALRGASYFYAVDTYEDLEPVREFSASHMIVTTC